MRTGCGCVPWLLAAVALGFADWYPWLWAVAAALAAAAAVAYLVTRHR